MNLRNTVVITCIILEAIEVSSKVYLKDCRYENLVVKLEDDIDSIIYMENMKKLLKLFTVSLNRHTRTLKKLSLAQVHFILPVNEDFLREFQMNEEMENIEFTYDETFASDASILVTKAENGSDERPLTAHLGSCGEEGLHIHFPIAKDKEYLDGTELLHEWAHYRWGIFDEYVTHRFSGNISPFYVTENKKLAYTSCPEKLKGWALNEDKSRCSLGENGLPDERCHFYVVPTISNESLGLNYKRNNISIMMGYKNRKDSFCSSNGRENGIVHNERAMNVHNRKCNGKSAWDIMQQHRDFQDAESSNCRNPCLNPVFKYLKRSKLDSAAILYEDSAEMLFNLSRVLSIFQKIAKGVNFDVQVYASNSTHEHITNNNIKKGIFPITPSNPRDNTLCKNFPENFVKILYQKTMEEENMWKMTPNCSFAELPFNLPECEMVTTFIDLVLASGRPKKELPQLIYSANFKKKQMSDEFLLDETCFKGILVFSFKSKTSESLNAVLEIMKPDGKICAYTEEEGCYPREITNFFMAEIDLNKQKKYGFWKYNVSIREENESFIMVFCVPSANETKLLSFNTRVSTTDGGSQFNGSTVDNKIHIEVQVLRGTNPVLNATVKTVIKSSQSYSQTYEELHDAGRGPDLFKDDGIYSGDFLSFPGNGYFTFSFEVSTTNITKALVRKKFLSSGTKYTGTRMLNQILPLDPDHVNGIRQRFGEPKYSFSLDEFLEPREGGQRKDWLTMEDVVTQTRIIVPTQKPIESVFHTKSDHHSPGKVTDLVVKDISYRRSTVTLQWTSTGDDGFSHGTADRILLKYFESRREYPRHFFSRGTKVKEEHLYKKSSLVPLPAGETHSVTIQVPKGEKDFPENVVFFFAMVVYDEDNHTSDVSNLATAFFKPEKYSDELQELKKKSLNSLMFLLVFLLFVVLIAGIILIVKLRQKKKKVPVTTEK